MSEELKVINFNESRGVAELGQGLIDNAERYRHVVIVMEEPDGTIRHSHTATEQVRLLGLLTLGIECLCRGFETND